MEQLWVDDEEFLAPPNYGESAEAPTDEYWTDDILAPPADVTARDEVVDELLDEPDDEEADWTPVQGFRDGQRVVHLWVNEDGLLRKVRISPNWRHKLGRNPLEMAFAAAFTTMNAVLHTGEHILPKPEPLPAVPHEGPASWDTIRRARRELAEIDAKLDALGDVPPTRWVGKQVEGTALRKAVVLRLGIFGEPVSVRFDPKWLAGPVPVNEIVRGVMDAYRRARTKYRPPHVEYGERDLLYRERACITDSMMATLRHGFRV